MESKRNNEEIFSKRVRAGRRRTYFIDVRTTRSNDYYVTITESKKKFDDDGYERHKIHLYKEDFNKFVAALNETVGHVKSELMPGYDFDQFNNDDDWQHKSTYNNDSSSSEGTESVESKVTDILDTKLDDSADLTETVNTDPPADDLDINTSPEINDPSADGEAETWDWERNSMKYKRPLFTAAFFCVYSHRSNVYFCGCF